MSQRDKLVELRNETIAEADALVATGTDESFTAAETKLDEVRALDTKIATATEVESRAAQIATAKAEAKVSSIGGAVVVSEARTYDRDKRNSWAKDLLMASPIFGDTDSKARLARHAKEDAVENRAGSTTAGAGGEFSPPAYLLADYAEFARAVSVAANLLTNEALPEGTSSIKIPQITTGTATGLQGGNNAAATTRDIVTAYVTSPVQTAAGYNDVSVQLIEQSPINMDGIIFGDLTKDLALKINTAVLANTDGTSFTLPGLTNLGLNGGSPITWTEATPSAGGFVAAVGKALAAIANTRFQDAEAIVMSPSTWYYVSSLLDSNNRPIFAAVSQAWNPVFTGDLSKSSGLVGMYGAGVPVYVDATMPKNIGAGTNQSPILVGKFSDSYLFKGAQKAGLFPDVGSSTLTVRYRLYQYVAMANRFNKAVAAISGTGTVVQSGF